VGNMSTRQRANRIDAALALCPICDKRLLAVRRKGEVNADWAIVLACEHVARFDGKEFVLTTLTGGKV